MRFRSRRALILAGASALPLGGCLAGGDEVGLLGAPPLPALRDDPVELGESPPPDAGPCLVGFDRRHWSPVTVPVPAGQVETHPPYADLGRAELPDEAWATTETCLHRSRWPGDELTVGGYVLGYTGWLTVAWPIEMAQGRLPWSIDRGPQGAFERSSPRVAADLWPWVVFEPADPDDDA